MLSAIGALLTALGATTPQDRAPGEQMEEPLAAAERVLPTSAIPPTRPRPQQPQPGNRAPTREPGAGSHRPALDVSEPIDDVSTLLAEARQRAEEIIEDSIARAEALLRPSSGDERLRAAVADVAADVRGLHRRLDTIEGLLRAGSQVAAQLRTFASPAAPAPPARTPAPPAEPGLPSSTTAPTRPVAPLASALPPSALPPRLDATAPQQAVPPQAVEPAEPTPTPPPPGFEPAGGAITLRISPVAGFQGLMRVQDALVRVPGISEAGVQAYAQGEARLRLHLSGPLDPQTLAFTLAEQLGRPTQVAAVSIAERTIQLVME